MAKPAPMDESTQILAHLRMSRVREVTRQGDLVRMKLAPPDGGQALVVSFEPCTELTLVPVDGGAPIQDPATLTALRLQLMHAQGVPVPTMMVFAWAPGPLRGGHLHVRAGSVAVADESGAPVARPELSARLDAARRDRAARFSATDYRRTFDGVLKRDVRPHLPGFHADRRSLLRAREGLVDIFETELGQWGSPESLEISVKLTILVGKVAKGAKLEEVSSKTLSAMSLDLKPPYLLTGNIDETELAARLIDDVERVARPFFDRVHGPDDVIAYLAEEDRQRGDHGNAFALAELLGSFGRLDEARAYYLVSPGVRDAIRRSAARFGISLDN